MTHWSSSEPQYQPEYPPPYGVFPPPPPPLSASPARRNGRLWAIVAVLAVVAAGSIALAALGTRHTVAGSGEALAAPGASTPSASVATQPPSTESTADWTLVTDAQAHLRVRLPGTPQLRSESGDLGGTSFTVNIAVGIDHASPVEAADEDITTAIASAEAKSLALRGSIASFSATSEFEKVSESATSFRGHPARTADFRRSSGRVYTLLVFFSSDRRLYFMFAERGTPFQTLTSSFVALP